MLPVGAEDEVENALEVIGGVEGDLDGSLLRAGNSDFHVGLKAASKLVLETSDDW